MNVILVKDIDRVGKAGETVSVKDGYGRNFLLPGGLALPVNSGTKGQIKAIQTAHARQVALHRGKAQEVADRLKGVSCTIAVSVGEQGKLHGAVTALDIVKALQDQGIALDRHQIVLEGPISQLGDHPVSVKLHPDVIAVVQVSVCAHR